MKYKTYQGQKNKPAFLKQIIVKQNKILSCSEETWAPKIQLTSVNKCHCKHGNKRSLNAARKGNAPSWRDQCSNSSDAVHFKILSTDFSKGWFCSRRQTRLTENLPPRPEGEWLKGTSAGLPDSWQFGIICALGTEGGSNKQQIPSTCERTDQIPIFATTKNAWNSFNFSQIRKQKGSKVSLLSTYTFRKFV